MAETDHPDHEENGSFVCDGGGVGVILLCGVGVGVGEGVDVGVSLGVSVVVGVGIRSQFGSTGAATSQPLARKWNSGAPRTT